MTVFRDTTEEIKDMQTAAGNGTRHADPRLLYHLYGLRDGHHAATEIL